MNKSSFFREFAFLFIKIETMNRLKGAYSKRLYDFYKLDTWVQCPARKKQAINTLC